VRFRVRRWWKPDDDGARVRATRAGSALAKGRKPGSAWARRDDEGGGGGRDGRGWRAGFWLRIVANHFNCARSSLEPLMASSVSDTAASGSSGRRSSTSRCSPSRTKTPEGHTPTTSWGSDDALFAEDARLHCSVRFSPFARSTSLSDARNAHDRRLVDMRIEYRSKYLRSSKAILPACEHAIHAFLSHDTLSIVAQGGRLSELDGVTRTPKRRTTLGVWIPRDVDSRAWLSAYATLFFRGRWVFKGTVKRPPGRVPL